MKTKNKLTTALYGMEPQPNPKGEGSPLDAVVTNSNEVFAKQKLQRIILTWMSILFAITLSLMATACKDGDEEEPTVRSSGTERPLTFGTDCKVTIKSDDKFTDDDWNKTCDKVVSAIESEYVRGNNFGNKLAFEGVFAGANNTAIVLSNSAAYKCEVKSGDKTTIYIKTSAIDTVDLQAAAMALSGDNGGVNQQAKAKVLGNGNNPIFANVNRNYQMSIGGMDAA
jgi:hypothetical protein